MNYENLYETLQPYHKSLKESLAALQKLSKTTTKETDSGDIKNLLKDLDYFKYAGYMQTGDHDIDPVRRIHTELMIPEKRQELAEYLTGFSQTEHENRIMDMVSSLRTLDQEQIKENRKTGHPSCRNAR